MKKSKRLVILACVLCLTGLAGAMVSTNYDLSWHVIGGGGGPMSSANYRMDGTVGEIIGESSSENYRLEAGYWYGAVTPAAPYPRWDINEDGTVNYLDLGMLAAHWGESITPPYPRWDINEDGAVNYLDLGMLAAHWGESY